MNADLAGMTIAAAAQGIRSGALSPVGLAHVCLDRIAAADPLLNACLHMAPDAALAEARKAEAELAAGRDRGPLHGIPVALKDVIDVAGMPSTANSRIFHDRVATQDAAAVERLREAGAVILGKLAAWECAIGTTSLDLPWPPARNPFDRRRDPGGSSSGSAVAIAAGLCLASIGTDTGGSIREPAAWCGVTGLKPTYGLVSCRGLLPVSATLDHAGPMAWTSEDCALMLDAIAGEKPTFGGSYRRALDGDLRGLRIGVVDLDCEKRLHLDDDVAASLAEAIEALADLGADIRRVRIAPLALYSAVVTVIAAAEAFAVHQHHLTRSASLYERTTRQRLVSGASVGAAAYLKALAGKRRLATDCVRLMREVDLLVMPASAHAAPPLGSFDSHGGHPSLTRPWNVAGNPALSLCSGFTAAGLPLAVQLVGRPFEEGTVLRAGHCLEQALGTRSVRPPLPRPGSEEPAVPLQGEEDEAAIARLTRDVEIAAALIDRRMAENPADPWSTAC